MSKEPKKDKPLGKHERVKLNISFDDALRAAAKKPHMTKALELYKAGDNKHSKQVLLINSVNKEVKLFNIQLHELTTSVTDYVVEVYIASRDNPWKTLNLHPTFFDQNKHMGYFVSQNSKTEIPYILTKEDATKYGNIYLLLKRKEESDITETVRFGTLVYEYGL